ncbi:VOC family protein [Acinetobacter sp. ANC 3882]|uniref:VOC family protein n=1 Tax=Acinetobacter sp. ANC 3882 TaxID=2923423 RepID=UPI001F4AD4AB|nr:VOC family protein [Acinetobacter sp. ANC 3882]MCH7314500.1 VOC family protein [Acinetobacter sp. ANC 3882]
MQNTEIDFIVKDTLAALAFYEQVFEVERIEVGDFVVGQNSVIMSIHGVHFHMLDENPDFQLLAPTQDSYIPIWFNITVTDIEKTLQQAVDAGAVLIQAVQHMPAMGIKNAMFKDPFGYMWLLHQVIEVVDYETRAQLLEQQGFQRKPTQNK